MSETALHFIHFTNSLIFSCLAFIKEKREQLKMYIDGFGKGLKT